MPKVIINFKKLRQFFEREDDKKINVVPVAVQEINSREILIIAHADRKALLTALRTRKAVFWSISRNELWIKGATSGNFLEIKEVLIDCENSSLIYLVELKGGACHTKDRKGQHRKSCFFRSLKLDKKHLVSTEEGDKK